MGHPYIKVTKLESCNSVILLISWQCYGNQHSRLEAIYVYNLYTVFHFLFSPFFPFPVTNQYPFHNPPPGPQSDLFVLRERREWGGTIEREREKGGKFLPSAHYFMLIRYWTQPCCNSRLIKPPCHPLRVLDLVIVKLSACGDENYRHNYSFSFHSVQCIGVLAG